MIPVFTVDYGMTPSINMFLDGFDFIAPVIMLEGDISRAFCNVIVYWTMQ
jgi:hypothetical protein